MAAFLSRLSAVALLTLREAIRKRVFLVLLVFCVALISIFAIMPSVDPTTKLRVIELWSLRAMSFFLMVIAVFVAGYSLPTEIERKNIHLLAAKPISKMTIVLGKYVGYLILLVLSLAIMVVVCIVTMRVVQTLMGPDGYTLTCNRRVFPKDFAARLPRLPTQARNFEEAKSVQIGGDEDSAFIFKFEGLDPHRFSATIPVKMRFEIGTPGDVSDVGADVLVTVRNPETGASAPIECLGVMTNEWYALGVPKIYIGDSGKLDLEVSRQSKQKNLTVNREKMAKSIMGMAIFEVPGSFEINFAMGSLLVLLQAVFVLTLSITMSTLVSGPVAALVAIVALLVCSLAGFMDLALEDVKFSLERASHGHDHDELPPWMLKTSSAVSKFILMLVPNFDKIDPTDALMDDLAIEPREVGAGIALIGLRVGMLVLLGCGLILLRDFS